MKIEKTDIPVDIQSMIAKIDATDKGKIYIVQDGSVVMYPLPAYGVMEISSQNYKIGKPKYHINAEN